MQRWVWIFLCLICGTGLTDGQNAAAQVAATDDYRVPAPAWAPKSGGFVDIEQVGIAKINREGTEVRVLLPVYRRETRIKEVTKVVPRTETKTETVFLDGQTTTREYEVTVMEKFTEEITVIVPVTVGHQQFTADLAQVQAREVSGALLSADALRKRLQTATHLLVLAEEEHPVESGLAIDPFFAPLLRPDTLVLHVPAVRMGQAEFIEYKEGALMPLDPPTAWQSSN